MPDIEKVIKGLEQCLGLGESCKKCPYKLRGYTNMDCRRPLLRDALAMLKEQEAIIEQYRRADGFLADHGWKWEGR